MLAPFRLDPAQGIPVEFAIRLPRGRTLGHFGKDTFPKKTNCLSLTIRGAAQECWDACGASPALLSNCNWPSIAD